MCARSEFARHNLEHVRLEMSPSDFNGIYSLVSANRIAALGRRKCELIKGSIQFELTVSACYELTSNPVIIIYLSSWDGIRSSLVLL